MEQKKDSDLTNHIGREYVSDWKQVTQHHFDLMMDAGEGFEWIHNDPERAKKEIGIDTTIAQGHLLLSNNVVFANQVLAPLRNEHFHKLNYGYEKIRFLNPVPVNYHIRAKFTIINIEPKEDNRQLMRVKVEQQIQESGKLSLVAEWLFMLIDKY